MNKRHKLFHLASQTSANTCVEQAFNIMVPWSRDFFGLSERWQPNLRTFWDPNIKTSKGGWFDIKDFSGRTKSQILAISINLCHHRFPNGDFWEYPHYANDPEIGRFFGPWQKMLWAVVAHELAHVVEFATFEPTLLDLNSSKNCDWQKLSIGNHSDRFQWIYRQFRRTWINNRAWETSSKTSNLSVSHNHNNDVDNNTASIETNTISLPSKIRVFIGEWMDGGLAIGKFVPVAKIHQGWRVAFGDGTRDIRVRDCNWVEI